jgi:ABC-2 type transport system ATP-binding protein
MTTSQSSADPMISVTGLSKSYGSHQVLADIDFTVQRGEIFALLGPNGAGKTTIVHVLTTLLPPDSGSISVAGHDLRTHPDRIRHHIGLTGQYAAVDEFQTAEENLLMMARLAHLGRREAHARKDALLADFDLVDAARKQVSSFSGGMRRRIDLAMSLVTSPDLLFLDEPTTGLDPRSRIALWDVVRRLADSGVTIFLTTQYLEEADRLADTVAVIDHGSIIARGTPEELKRGVAGQHIELTFDSVADLTRAIDLLDSTNVTVSTATHSVAIATEAPPQTIRQTLTTLESGNVPVANITIVRPTLDDVFLALTR